MRTAFGRSPHTTNWMTITLLTVFLMGFGIFANSRADTQSTNRADAVEDQCQVASHPTICRELQNSQWLGALQTALHDVACKSEHSEVAELDSNLTNSRVEVRGS
jgi:hypothetical protein